ncbi:MAG: hypothetical protein VKN56_11230 [Cyanobacteriota bacterium]|nr:hypothetical protein [Cyanobacteriota bacterium]
MKTTSRAGLEERRAGYDAVELASPAQQEEGAGSAVVTDLQKGSESLSSRQLPIEPMARTPSPRRADASAADLQDLDAAGVQGLKPEQALALIGMGLMRKLAAEGDGAPWMWSAEEDSSPVDGPSLRQRLELVDLALRTAAPLSTAEVTHLMGARPGSAVVERGGLLARRQSRNVWILSRSDSESAAAAGHFQETPRRRF